MDANATQQTRHEKKIIQINYDYTFIYRGSLKLNYEMRFCGENSIKTSIPRFWTAKARLEVSAQR